MSGEYSGNPESTCIFCGELIFFYVISVSGTWYHPNDDYSNGYPHCTWQIDKPDWDGPQAKPEP